MRFLPLTIACATLAACTTGPVSAPRDAVLYEVRPQAAAGMPRQAGMTAAPQVAQAPAAPPAAAVTPPAQAAARDDFTRRIEMAIDRPAQDAPGTILPPAPVVEGVPDPLRNNLPVPQGAQVAGGQPLDADRLNLNEYTLEQQRIDAAIAERQLEEARRQLVIVEPGASVPQPVEGVNIALFAKQTTHQVGERRYARPVTAALNRGSACRRFATADDAQRFFLANGGPERDPYGLDPDGDGFACNWDPEPFRRLRL
jgi:hypothetical protein